MQETRDLTRKHTADMRPRQRHRRVRQTVLLSLMLLSLYGLIAYMLLKVAKAAQSAVRQPLAFARLVRLNIMHRRPIDALNTPPPPPLSDPRQMKLDLVTC